MTGGEQKPSVGKAAALVLIVEDEGAISSFVAEVVADAGYQAEVAANGQEALARAHAHWPDLVVSDLMLPYLDGLALIRILRSDAEIRGLTAPPVIIMTSAGLTYARAAHADAVLRKPFSLDELDDLLHRFLG